MQPNATEKYAPPPRRRVYLMRHGSVDYFDAAGRPLRPDGVALNDEGRRQAEAAGRLLADVPLDRAVSSGLPRAVETARLVLAPRTLPLETRPDLREIEPGRLASLGHPLSKEVERAFVGALHTGLGPDDRFLGGETFASLAARVEPCFRQLLAEPGWNQMLVVAHGAVNLLLLSTALGAGLGTMAVLEQENGCINILDAEPDGRCLVRAVNCTPLNPLKVGVRLTTMEGLYAQYRRYNGG
jgi:broad specificity phosphatase PhoE